MKRAITVSLLSLGIASASTATTHATEPINPGHPRWFGNGSGPTGADLIAWVSQRATKAPTGDPDPAYFARSGGPVGADLVAKLAKVQRKERAIDLVNAYGRGAPTLQQLTQHRTPDQPVFASAPAPTVK
jgi:hypothetical protein